MPAFVETVTKGLGCYFSEIENCRPRSFRESQLAENSDLYTWHYSPFQQKAPMDAHARRRQHKPELRFEDLHVRVDPNKGDIDEMDKRRVVGARRPQ
jgi:hypothetical protein